MKEDYEEYLVPTRFIDFEHPSVREVADRLVANLDPNDQAEKSRVLFYFVRDNIPYKVPLDIPTRRSLRASITLKNGYGFCISKAVLMVALARANQIPARLHFADIRNHLLSPSLLKMMGTNLFVYHGYAEVLVNGEWLKINPAFDIALTEEKGYIPVNFDGKSHAVFQKNDKTGTPHIEYVSDRGTYADVPFTDIVNTWFETYAESAWLAVKEK